MGSVNANPNYLVTMGLGNADGVVFDSTKQGGIVSIYYLGTLLGSLLGGMVSDRFGRKIAVVTGCFWVFLGASLMASAMNVTWMLLARVLAGIGTGQLTSVVPIWSAETSGHLGRGAYISYELTFEPVATVIGYWMAYGLTKNHANEAFEWRFLVAFQLIPVLFLVVLVNFLPESPRFLIKKRDKDTALEVLARIRTKDVNYNDPMVVAEMESIIYQEQIECTTTGKMTYFHMITGYGRDKLHITRRVWLCFGLMIMQLWSGIFAVSVYGPIVFSQAGFSAQKVLLINGVNNIIYMCSTVVCGLTVDRIGRRKLMIIGAVAMGVCWLLAGGFSELARITPTKTSTYGATSVAFIIIYNAVFGASWLTPPYIYSAEVYPLEVRGKGMALGVLAWSVGNGMCGLVTPIMFSAWSGRTLFFFGAINFAWVPVIWCFYPETAKRTLEEMDYIFSSKSLFVSRAEKKLSQGDVLPTDLRAKHDPDELERASKP